MHWNTRIVHTKDGYGVYEVFYNEKDEPWARDSDPMLYGETLGELREYIEMMMKDIAAPVLEDKDIDISKED